MSERVPTRASYLRATRYSLNDINVFAAGSELLPDSVFSFETMPLYACWGRDRELFFRTGAE
jgi:hypothetical protein